MVASEVTELLYSETLILEILPLSQAGLMAWRERCKLLILVLIILVYKTPISS